MATVQLVDTAQPTLVVGCLPSVTIVGPSIANPYGEEIACFDGTGWLRDDRHYALVRIDGPLRTSFAAGESSRSVLGPFTELLIEGTELRDAKTGEVIAKLDPGHGSWLIPGGGSSAGSIFLN